MIKLKNETKGIILAISAAFAVSNVYIFSKAAINEVHLAQFGLYWFGLGIIWNVSYIFIIGKQKELKTISRSSVVALVLIAVLEMVGTLFFFLSIKTVSNPAIVSFLANINPLFVTFFGIVFLKERFNKIEFFGMGILLAGAAIISVKGTGSIESLFIPGVQYVLISGILFSIASIIAKKQIKYVNASFLALSRIILLFIFSLISLVVMRLSFSIPMSAFGNIAIGSILGPFLTATLGYMSLKYIEVSKASMVRSIRSLFVLIGSFLYFGSLPGLWQIIGGIFTISGVILISSGKLKLSKSS